MELERTDGRSGSVDVGRGGISFNSLGSSGAGGGRAELVKTQD